MTGFVDLTDQVDMSCAKYENTGKYDNAQNKVLMLMLLHKNGDSEDSHTKLSQR